MFESTQQFWSFTWEQTPVSNEDTKNNTSKNAMCLHIVCLLSINIHSSFTFNAPFVHKLYLLWPVIWHESCRIFSPNEIYSGH